MAENEELKSLYMKVKEESEKVGFFFWGVPKSLQMVTAAMKVKDAYFLEEKLWPT